MTLMKQECSVEKKSMLEESVKKQKLLILLKMLSHA